MSASLHHKARRGNARGLIQPGLQAGRHARKASGRRGQGIAGYRALAASGRQALAVSAGKAARGAVRYIGGSNGTSVPGVAALAIDHGTLASLAGQIGRGTVLVTGTNGKGTTCRMLAGMMRAAGLHPILNHEGANQPPGLTTTLLTHTTPSGRLPDDDRAIGLFEVDEGSLPEILPQVKPTVVVFTNVFRDQMDRYLDLDYLTRRFEQCLRSLPADTTLVLNADDPRLGRLASDLENPRVFYGLEDRAHRRSGVDHTSDFPRCPRCTGELRYRAVFYAHLGHWECGQCGLARPAPRVHAAKVDLIGPGSSRIQVVAPGTEAVLEVPLPGLHNAYNVVAAAAAATACQLPSSVLTTVEDVTPGFFRMERVTVAGRDVHLTLAKNQNGYTEVLRALLGDGQPRHMMLGLNDRVSDQQPDVSWIWDIDFETLRGLVPAAVLCGNRAADLALRLKYARWTSPAAGLDPTGLTVEPDPIRAFLLALDQTPPGQPLWVVATYQVLWRLRDWMRHEGLVGPIWER